MNVAPDNEASNEVLAMLRQFRLRFNPFRYLEASDDQQLASYLVDHEVIARALDSDPAVIFAPAGGGKTTMRMMTTYTYWMNRTDARVFPLPYFPRWSEPEQHLDGIARAGALSLLIGLLHFPRRFFAIGRAEQAAVARFLASLLPLPFLIDRLRSSSSVAAFGFRVEKSYRLPEPEGDPTRLWQVLSIAQPEAVPLAPEDKFTLLRSVVVEALEFQQLVVQIDNVDANAEQVGDYEAMVERIAYPIQNAAPWAERSVVVKAFLPSELAPELQRQAPLGLAALRPRQVVWTETLLVEVLQRRIIEATGGEFTSLDAVASPALSSLERTLVAAALPLPREVLVLTGQLLACCAARLAGAEGRIEPDDLTSALEWYDAHRVNPGPLGHL